MFKGVNFHPLNEGGMGCRVGCFVKFPVVQEDIGVVGWVWDIWNKHEHKPSLSIALLWKND